MQGVQYHVPNLIIGLFVEASGGPMTQQAFEVGRMREFGCLAKSPPGRIVVFRQLLTGHIEWGGTELIQIAALTRIEAVERVPQALILFLDVIRMLLIEGGDMFQHFHKGRHPMPSFRGKVGAGEKRRQISRGQKHCQRPATPSLVQQLVRALVNLVQIWPFLTIHLDIDKQPIHDIGRAGVLEGFVGHDVAPVTGGITNRQQNRQITLAGDGQRFVIPGIPVDRIMGMLQQIGTGFVGEPVGVLGHDRSIDT